MITRAKFKQKLKSIAEVHMELVVKPEDFPAIMMYQLDICEGGSNSAGCKLKKAVEIIDRPRYE
ncbi:MAG: hypothetical protein ACOX1G_05185 [bacterium]